MSLGFLKDVNGIKRLRIVKPGYDANNLNLPVNAVVFDSVYPSNLVIYDSGVATVSTAGTDTRIVSWPDPGYVPMTLLMAKSSSGGWWYSVVPWTSNNPVASVRADGILLTTGSFNLPVDISYFAFRVAA
ncbi:hypothetical protein GCM10011491_31170 [Brucella endophytica]|uniref:Uncharacterized protein n=1 Tax=Brucella endophytica TaxID=1963359 RepID=A0A916SJI9_9HYPH|nr:hypothetical protein [Brucella endophytica]GGB00757.1 hypothetical protein GCM10011491_31170 [Brucella endophytica]